MTFYVWIIIFSQQACVALVYIHYRKYILKSYEQFRTHTTIWEFLKKISNFNFKRNSRYLEDVSGSYRFLYYFKKLIEKIILFLVLLS